ncbi:MAG: hypothetical protein RL172_1808 [Bacteroidota bacterium]|jgi:hypothetical protein
MKQLFMVGILLTALITSSCNSTKIAKSWRDADTQVSLDKLDKILVVAMLRNEANRRSTEDKLVAMLKNKGVTGIPSYQYIGGTEVKKEISEAIREQLHADGFDGAITMRLVDVDKEVNYTPGTFSTYPVYYRSFGGYMRRGWEYYSTPDRYYTTKTYSVETNVFSIKKDKLIWSSLTESTDPGGVDKMTDEVSKVVYKSMLKEGFITQ